MDGAVIRRRFQHTELGVNMNRFWIIEWKPGLAHVTWGREGVTNQFKDFPGWTERDVEAKIREKLGKGYREVDLHVPVAVCSGVGTDDPKLAQVVDTIYSEAGETISSYLSVGVNALSQSQIERGRDLLTEAQNMSYAGSYPKARLVQDFYNTIPTKLPPRIDRDRVVEDFFNNMSEIEDRLNQLEAAIATLVVQKTGTSNVDALGAEVAFLSQTDNAYERIVDFVRKTSLHGISYQVRDILTVRIPKERAAYEADRRGKGNRLLLVHGTASGNVRHILRSGLVIPRTSSNGSMFGRGIYFADTFSKSANYCSVRRAPYQFIFMAEVALGKVYTAPDAIHHLTFPPDGDSVKGAAGHTRAWGGTLKFNEYVIYRTSQQTIQYLILFER